MAALTFPEIVRFSLTECMQCGICTSVCPKRKVSKFNPRELIHRSLMGESLDHYDLSQCLTCLLCLENCPQLIDFPEYIRELRTRTKLDEAVFAHHNIFNLLTTFSVVMTDSGMKYNFQGETDPASEIGYFPGCVDLFDRFLSLEKVRLHDIAQSTVNVLNKLGIKPQIVSLKCCGHDSYWTGDMQKFGEVKRFNERVLKESGVKKLVLSCAECYYTFSNLYNLEGVEVVHLSRFVTEHSTKPALRTSDTSVTYHDPCRLGRFMEEYEAPRTILKGTNGDKFIELQHAREQCSCCGVSAWVKCDDEARALMLKKLEEATQTGAETLVVSCTKCFSHLNCVLEDKKPQHNYTIKVKDLSMVLDEAMN